MCGIAGVLCLDGSPLSAGDRQALTTMAAALAHRGPDDEQFFVHGPLGFAFRRLSIVDVVGGRQPLCNEDETVVLVANGEIYNHEPLRARLAARHRFRSRSDCEVVLHLYEDQGAAALGELTGMFGLAIWDSQRQKLSLARDRFGIKPLFYAFGGGRLMFASEIKALFQHPDCPRAFDWQAALEDPLMNGAISTDLSDPVSYFRGIEHLPAASLLEVEVPGGARTPRRYWQLPVRKSTTGAPGSANEEGDASALTHAYRERLRDAVRDCLMSDVELGIFLSGGLDSAAVAAFAAEAGSNCHTFSVLSQSTLANGDAQSGHAVARALGLPNHQVVFRWDRLPVAPEDWKALVWLCETPHCGAEQLYKYHLHGYAKRERPGLKVMLTGQGSDEFNGGYGPLLAAEGARSWPGVLEALAGMERGRLLRGCPASLLSWEARFPRPPLSQAFLGACAGEHDVNRALGAYTLTKYRDLQMYNCWHEDRTAAGHSIENRVPFLDHRLVELVLTVPEAYHAGLFWDKRILRDAMAGILPPEVCERPKGPFFYGSDERFTHRMMLRVLTDHNGALLDEAFSNDSAREVIDRDAIADIIAGLADDPSPVGVEALVRLVNMGLLDGMARRAPAPVTQLRKTDCVLPPIPVEDWERDRETIEISLGVRREQIGLDAVLGLPPSVALMRREDSPAAGTWYISVNNRIEYEIPGREAAGWLKVLRLLDGHRTLGEVLQRAAVSEGEIRKYLEEALDFGVVAVQPAG